MPDYQKGKIYKIIDLDTNECYIGSTTLALSQRLAQHVSSYKSYLKGKSNNVTSFEIIENGNYDIVLIEVYPCNSKEELHARESYYCQTMECVNKVKQQGLKNALGEQEYCKQYKKQHKDQIKEQQKKYSEEHKDQIKEKSKEYYEQHKDQIKEQQKKYSEEHKDQIKEKKKEYKEQHKDQIKEYYQENKEHYQEQKKQYREQNKNSIKEKHQCECGGCYTTVNKTRHFRLAKHLKYMENQKN